MACNLFSGCSKCSMSLIIVIILLLTGFCD